MFSLRYLAIIILNLTIASASFADPEKLYDTTRVAGVLVRFVPEMEPVVELQNVIWCDSSVERNPARFEVQIDGIWAKVASAMEKTITPAIVKDLSLWAKEQMSKYKRVPPLGLLRFKVLGNDTACNFYVAEATIDTLPTHSKLVTRWLKLFLVVNIHSGKVEKAIITIRGQLLE